MCEIYTAYESEVLYEDSKINKDRYLDEIARIETSHAFSDVQKDGMILEILDIQAKEISRRINKELNS